MVAGPFHRNCLEPLFRCFPFSSGWETLQHLVLLSEWRWLWEEGGRGCEGGVCRVQTAGLFPECRKRMLIALHSHWIYFLRRKKKNLFLSFLVPIDLGPEWDLQIFNQTVLQMPSRGDMLSVSNMLFSILCIALAANKQRRVYSRHDMNSPEHAGKNKKTSWPWLIVLCHTLLFERDESCVFVCVSVTSSSVFWAVILLKLPLRCCCGHRFTDF